MRIDARFGHSQVPYDNEFDTHLVISLTGEESATAERPRLGIIPVLDRTGSMHGEKLRTATAALAHLCGFLDPGDALGLVTFAETAETPLDPKPNQRDRYMSALAEIQANGMTNLAAGLTRGVELAKDLAARWAGTRFEIRVILISDGLANVGICAPDEIARIVDDLGTGVRVTAIGVGRDCDHDLLSRIAAVGGGSYGFAEGSAAIPRLLGAEFGAALSIDASDIEVEVTAKDYVELEAPLGVSATEVRGGWRVAIPTLLAGETRHLVLPATTREQGRRHARRVSAAVVKVSDLVGREASRAEKVEAAEAVDGVMVELRPKLFFNGKTDTVPPSLMEAIDRAIAAEALGRAETLAAAGEYRLAMGVLADASSVVSTPGVAASVRSASGMYNSAERYASASAERSSLTSAMSPSTRLIGSSDAFDASWSQTMGISYQTSGMRSVAAEAAAAVDGGSGASQDGAQLPSSQTGPRSPQTGQRPQSLSERVAELRGQSLSISGGGSMSASVGETSNHTISMGSSTTSSTPSSTTSEADISTTETEEGGEEE